MIDYSAFIKEFSEHCPFDEFYEKGITSDDIKAAIIKTFEPYFENQERLKEYSMLWLIGSWVNFSKFKKNQWHFDKFEKCLTFLNQAKSRNIPCCDIFAEWLPEFNQGLSKFWSFRRLSQNLEKLDNEEFLEETLKLIGQITEGITKAYLRCLLHISRLSRAQQVSKQAITNLDLGIVVDELIRNTNFPELFSPPPWNIKLSQWRNIAYHHNAKVDNNSFLCWYGKDPNIRTCTFSRDELLGALRSIFNVYNTFKNVELVFVFDNLPEYQAALNAAGQVDTMLREEAGILDLFAGINSQGFKIIDFSKDTGGCKLIVQDLTDGEIKKRAIHSSQFLYSLWFYTQSPQMSVEYRLRNGKPYLISSTNRDVCEKIGNNERGIEYLAEKVEFNFI